MELDTHRHLGPLYWPYLLLTCVTCLKGNKGFMARQLRRGEAALFSASLAVMMHGYSQHPHTVRLSYYRLLLRLFDCVSNLHKPLIGMWTDLISPTPLHGSSNTNKSSEVSWWNLGGSWNWTHAGGINSQLPNVGLMIECAYSLCVLCCTIASGENSMHHDSSWDQNPLVLGEGQFRSGMRRQHAITNQPNVHLDVGCMW